MHLAQDVHGLKQQIMANMSDTDDCIMLEIMNWSVWTVLVLCGLINKQIDREEYNWLKLFSSYSAQFL